MKRAALLRACLFALLISTCHRVAAEPIPVHLSASDKRALATLTLKWAVDGGIPDFKLVKDPSDLIVESRHLPRHTVLTLPGHKVTLLSPRSIQARADRHGDFLYFRLGPFGSADGRATVPVSLIWAVSADSKTHYLSGGGATLNFEKHDGEWHLLPVASRWMS